MVLSVAIPLMSAFFGAVATIISKEIISKTGYKSLTALTFLTMFVLMAPLSPFFFSLSNYSLAAILFLTIICFDALANLLFFKGLNLGEASKATALDSLAPLFTAFITPFILPGQFGIDVFIAAIGITLGVYFIQTGHGFKEFLDHLRFKKNYLIIFSALIFGFTAILVRMSINELDLTNASTLYWIRSLGIFLIIYTILRPNITGFDHSLYGIIALKGSIVIVSWVSLFYAIANFNLIITYALAKTVPLFALILAWEELGEEITKRKILAILMIISFIIITQML